MMKLSEIYEAMIYGEMKNIFPGDNADPGKIDSTVLPSFLTNVQRGLTALHTRFDLKLCYFNLRINPSQRLYIIDEKFADSVINSLPKSIDDSVYNFTNRKFLKLVSIETAEGQEVHFEEPAEDADGNTITWKSPSNKEILVPETFKGTTVKVWYRRDHETISQALANNEPSIVDINISHVYLDALILYVASKMSASKGFGVEGTNESNNYEVKYNRECIRLDVENFGQQRGVAADRFINNGWV